ncbi:MAG: MBL fold metallo-hydrolase [Acidobacteria bacterium]|nr:MBL fold metallo-hydrolase [Acidobacteriota bacterium]
MIKRTTVVLAGLVVVGGAVMGCNAGTDPDAAAAPPAEAATAAAVQLPPEVERLTDNVYLFTNSTHRSLFVVTDEAVLATDPQGSQANAERFVEAIGEMTDAPIRQVVYSHHHGDHILGGEAFPADAEFIAHRNAEPYLVGSEARSVDRFVGDDETIDVGGLQVRLIYPGPSETDSSLIIFVPERRVAFMVDAVSVRTLPWRTMEGADPRDWIAALERFDELDFDILAPGHGPTGQKSDVRENILYLQTLVAAVQERIDQGQTLEEIQDTLELPDYADWVRYDEHFEENIQGVYRELAGG